MRIVKWTFWLSFWLMIGLLLHYVLPQRDIVRVVGTEIIRTDFSSWNRIFYAQADSGGTDQPTRDLRLINTVRANGSVMVYRNEDTGAFWPPYFKFDSSDLQAEAADAQSTAAAPAWYAMTHYGWRIRYLTIYPNAISLTPVAGPDVRLIPWFNIVFLTLLAALVWGVTVRWRRFKRRAISPRLDQFDAAVDERRAGFSRWLASWRAKPPRR